MPQLTHSKLCMTSVTFLRRIRTPSVRALLLAVTAMAVLVALSNVLCHGAEHDVTVRRWVKALSNTKFCCKK